MTNKAEMSANKDKKDNKPIFERVNAENAKKAMIESYTRTFGYVYMQR